MLKRVAFWGWFLLFFPAAWGLVLHGYLSSLTRLIADDFCSVYIAQRLGFLRSIWFWYRGWSGGYSTSIFDYLLEIFGHSSLPFFIPAFLFVWFLAVAMAVKSLLPVTLDRADKILFSQAVGATTLFSILSLSPNVPQSVYWWVGFRAYSISLILATLYVSLLTLFSKRKTSKPWLRVIGCAFFFFVAFINSGFNETFTAIQVVVFAELLLVGFGTGLLVRKSPTLPPLLAGFLGSVVGLLVMLASPGNAVRQEFFPESQNFIGIFTIALNSYFPFLAWLISVPERVLGLLVSVLIGVWVGTQLIPSRVRISFWMIGAVFVNGLVLMFGCFVPAAYGMSEAAPDRTLITAIYLLVVNFLIGGILLGIWLSQKRSFTVWLKPAVVFVLTVSFWFVAGSNIRSLYDSIPEYVAYAEQWDFMDTQIKSAKVSGKSEIHIPAKQNWAGLYEPNDNPKFWVTMCMSKYYDIKIIGPNPDTP